MTKRMLIDATHSEETRVVVVSGNRLEEFDYETSTKKQLKGNIYLAKVTRVEPSLQAAFVDYGGNRHGFLAFSEIHPDYYRIPIADREALMSAEAGEDNEPAEAAAERSGDPSIAQEIAEMDTAGSDDDGSDAPEADAPEVDRSGEPDPDQDDAETDDDEPDRPSAKRRGRRRSRRVRPRDDDDVETVGGDEIDDVDQRRKDWYRKYRIQEVISRRQILLVQVAKEERGNKGAALTTYISLAGRYCVLMPNTPRGGGISRKITNAGDRKRLKSMLDDFNLPEGMAVIVRTAGMERTKAEVRRDYEYLLKLWDDIRERTLNSTAPALIHEEANLIKRSIRDLYTKDIDEVLVDGEEGYKTAKNFMKMLMPSHAKKVKRYQDESIPLFHRYQVEQQLDNIHSPVVQLKSGGYIVLNATEALVAIDVNSGRSTRERNIEETAYRTNLEAADEIARQLRLRDLAGLIVIDFIDMDEGRNRANVEKRLKEAMKSDRARIQLGRISPFGLLELSRQRLRPSVIEASMQTCPHCGGAGMIRSTESTALHILRAIEEEGLRKRSAELTVYVPSSVALYILNQKRRVLSEIEARHGLHVSIQADDGLVAPDHRIERVGASAETAEREESAQEDEEQRSKSRRRGGRRRGGKGKSEDQQPAASTQQDKDTQADASDESDDDGSREGKSRRRGRRGGRRRRRPSDESKAASAPGDRAEAAPAEAAPAESAPAQESEPAEAASGEAEDKSASKGKSKAKSGGRPRKSTKKAEEGAEGKPSGRSAKTAKSKEAGTDDAKAKAANSDQEEGGGAPETAGAKKRGNGRGSGGGDESEPSAGEREPAEASPQGEDEERDTGARRTGWWAFRR